MYKYIALLRGINVSGQKLIKMESLREMFIAMKFSNVQTYIQSGNVIFETKLDDYTKIQNKIDKHLHKSLGYEVTTVLRSNSEIENVIKMNPFPKLKPAEQLYVTFLSDSVNNELKKSIESLNNEIERFAVNDKEIYVVVDKSSTEKSLFSNNFLEKKLKLRGTTRNWNTVNKLFEMCDS